MNPKELKAKTVGANEAYQLYHVTRAWLRERRNEGKIRCSETHGVGFNGRPYIKYLYDVEDIERELASFASRSQEHKAKLGGDSVEGGGDRW